MRMEEMQEQLNHEMDQLEELKKQMTEVIQQVKDVKLQIMLVYKYLEGMTYDQISVLMKVDKSTISRWHKKAISQIILPEDAIMAKLRF